MTGWLRRAVAWLADRLIELLFDVECGDDGCMCTVCAAESRGWTW